MLPWCHHIPWMDSIFSGSESVEVAGTDWCPANKFWAALELGVKCECRRARRFVLLKTWFMWPWLKQSAGLFYSRFHVPSKQTAFRACQSPLREYRKASIFSSYRLSQVALMKATVPGELHAPSGRCFQRGSSFFIEILDVILLFFASLSFAFFFLFCPSHIQYDDFVITSESLLLTK